MRVTSALPVALTSSASSAVGSRQAQLDQLVIGQRTPRFRQHAGVQALVTDLDHGL
jgi:hypothetical protein